MQPPVRIPLSTIARRVGHSPISDLMSRALTNPGLISLAAGFVDYQTLPVERLAAAAQAVLGNNHDARRALQYGTTLGDIGLRTRLVRRLEAEDRVDTGKYEHAIERTVITTGSQQLLYLIAETLLDPGDIVLVEAPSYFVFLSVLEARGARAIGVEVDEGGMRIDALESRLAEIESRGELGRVKLIYTVSEHSNPTGLSLDADRRSALVRVARSWSKGQRIYILEDAAYRGLTYEGTEPPSVWSHDNDGQTVIHARTFSKTLSPGIKTGYAIVPEAILDPLLTLKGNHDFGSSQLNQRLVERLLADDTYDSHAATLRSAYDVKRRVMLDALDEHLAPLDCGATWTHPMGGLYVWLTLPPGVDTSREGPLFDTSIKNGVLYVPGVYAYAAEPQAAPLNCARLTYGLPSVDEIDEGIRRLVRSIKESGCLNSPGVRGRATAART